MKSKITKTLALAAAVFGLQLFADAPTPAAVWDGDFKTTVKGSYTLYSNDNTVASDGSTITIGSKGVKVWRTDTAAQSSGMTVMYKYSGMTFDKDQTLAGFYGAGNGTYAGVRLKKNNVSLGICADSDWTTGPATTTVFTMGSGTIAETYKSDNGTYCYHLANNVRTLIYGSAALLGSTTHPKGANVAGRHDGTYPSAGTVVSAIAIFEKVLTEDEMKAYKFPSDKTYTATLSENKSFSQLSWTPNKPAGGFGPTATLIINNTAAAKLTIDENITVGTFKIENTSDNALTLAFDGHSINAAFDKSAATGGVTIDVSGIYGANIAKYAVAGVPYSYWYIYGPGDLPVEPSTMPTMPEGYSIAANQKYTGYGMRLVVTAPDTAKYGAVSVNVRGGTSETLASASNFGLYPMLGSNWGYQNDATAATQEGVTFTPYISTTGFATENNVTGVSANTDPKYIFRGTCRDFDDLTTIGYTLSGLANKYDKYRVIVYMATDSANISFAPVRINNVTYCGPATGTTVGYTIKGSTAMRWGATGSNKVPHAVGEGVNAVISDVLTGDQVTIRAIRAHGSTATSTSTRASIAAIQVVKVGEAVVTYEAEVTQDCNWSDLWTSLPPAGADVKLTRSGDATDATVTIDANVSLNELTVTSDSGKNLALALGSEKTFASSTYDFSAAQGRTTVNFSTGAAAVTAGSDTVLQSGGTGALILGADKKATITNGVWPGSVSRDDNSILCYSGTTQLSSVPYTTGKNATTSDGRVVYGAPIANQSSGVAFMYSMSREFANGFTLTTSRFVTGNKTDGANNPAQTFVQNAGSSIIVNGQGADSGDKLTATVPVLFAHWPSVVTYTMNGGVFDARQSTTDGTQGARVAFGRDGRVDLIIGTNTDDAYFYAPGIFHADRDGKGMCTLKVGQKGNLIIGDRGIDFTRANDKVLKLSGGVFANYAANTIQTTADITLEAGSVISNDYAMTISSAIAGSYGITKKGTGVLTLSGANTYSGGTTVGAGMLTIGHASAMGTGNYTVAANATLNLGQYRPTTAKLVGTSAGTVVIKMTSEEQADYEAGSPVTLIDVEGTSLSGTVQILKTDGTEAATTVTISSEGKLVATKRENTKTPPYNLTTAAEESPWTAASWMDSAATPAQVESVDWDYEVGANIALAAGTTTSLTLDRTLTLSTLNITNAGTLAIADTSAFTMTATAIDDSASTGTTTIDFASGAAVITAGVNTVVNKAGTGSIVVQSGKKATVPAYYYDHRSVFQGGYLKIMGDLGEKSMAKNSGLASNGATIDIGGTATLDGEFTSDVANTKLVVSGNVNTKSSVDSIKLAHNDKVVFEVAGGTLTLQNRVMVQQNTTGQLVLSGGEITSSSTGFLYPGGGWGGGSLDFTITGGKFTAGYNPFNKQLGCNAKVNISGGEFAPANLWTTGDGNKPTSDDTATSRSGSKFAVNMTGGKFLMPAGVPNWLPVNITSGLGELSVQDGVTTVTNRGLLTLAANATARINAGQGKTIVATGGITSSGTIALVSGTLKVDSDTFTPGTVNFNGGTLDINGKTASGVTLQGNGTIHNTAATQATFNGIIIPAGESKQVENGVIVLPEATGAIHMTIVESTTANWSEIIWLNSSDVQVRIGDVSKVDSAALTVVGTMTVDNWTSISALATKLTIGGMGRVEYTTSGTTPAYPTWGWQSSGDTAWAGTYKLSGFNGEANKTTCGSDGWDIAKYFNGAASAFEFDGTVTGGWFDNYSATGHIKNMGELILPLGKSITLSDGHTGENINNYRFRKLSGAGSLSFTSSKTQAPGVLFLDVAEFSGSITQGSSCSYRIVIGNGDCVVTGYTPDKKKITFDGISTLNAAATFTAGTGFVVSNDATVTAESIARFGGTTGITVSPTGTIEFTKSCVSGDESTDYSRITGDGKFKLSGSGYFLLPKTSATRPAKELQFVNEKDGGVIVTEASSTAGTAPVTEIGTLSGSKNFRMDWAPAYDNNRSLKILQAHNSTWTGKFGNNQNRLKEFIVAGATGATEKTLTLSATFDNANPTLNVESTGSVRLTGTWAGSATISGEIMGSGAIQGTATFNSGATLVVETEGSVLTVNTIAGLDGVTVKLPAGVTKEQVTDYTIIKLASATASTLDLGEVTIFSGAVKLGEFDIVITAGSTDAKPVAGAEYVATIPSDATSPVDFKTLSWSPALPEGDMLPTAAHWTITNEASEVTLNIAQDLAANMLKIVGASGKNLTLATTVSVSSSHYDFSETVGKVTVGFGTGAATITLAGETELKVMPTATSGFEVAEGKKLVLGWDSSDAYSQVISGAGAVDVTGAMVQLSANNTFTGALTVRDGATLKMGSTTCLGNANAATVEQGGTFDFNGKMDNGGTIAITLNGGTLTNTGSSLGTGNTAMASITLGADSTIDLASGHNWGMIAGSHGATSIDLNGYTLTKMGDGTFYLISTTISDAGSLVIDGGTVNIANKGSLNVSCETATVVVNNGATLSVDSGKSPTIAKLTVNGGTISNSGTITGLAEIKGNVDLGSIGTVTLANSVTVGTEGGEDVITVGSLDLTSKSFTVNGGTLNLAQDGTARSVGGLTIANPATLVISTNETAAAVAVTGPVDLENATIVLSGLLPAAGGTAKILSATGGITNYEKALAEIRGEWTIQLDGTTLTATKKKANYVRPGTDGNVSDVGNDTDSLDIGRDLAIKATKDMPTKVTESSTASEVANALNQTGKNTYKVWESAVLGLDPNDAASQLVITPIQGSSTTTVTLQVPTVNVDTTTGADVTFCFWSKTSDGDWAEVQGGVVESGEQKALALPASGVMYYQLRTTIKAGQLTPIPTVIPSANIVAAGAPVMTTPGTQNAASMGTKTLDAVSSSLTVGLAGAGVYEGQEYHLEVTEPTNADENHFAIVAKADANKTVTFHFGKNVQAGTTCKLTLLSASGAPNGNIAVKPDEGFEGVTYDNVMVTAMLANRPHLDDLGGVADHTGYRIPAVATDGNGEVIACYDVRDYKSSGWTDLGHDTGIDVGESYSKDRGVSFNAPKRGINVQNCYAHPNKLEDYSKHTDMGDVCMVWDPSRGQYWILGMTGNGLAGNNTNSNDVVVYTRARGENSKWTAWHNPDLEGVSEELDYRSIQHTIMSQVVGSGSSGKGFLQGPGHGMVTKIGKGDTMPIGTVVFPVQYFIGTAQAGAIYLKPGTPTVENNWKATGRTTADGSQENCVMELDDGSWYMMCKKPSQGTGDPNRYKAWRTVDFTNWVDVDDGLSDVAAVQGSCLKIGSKNNIGQYVFCHVNASTRRNLTMFFGHDTTKGETGTIPSTDNKGIRWDMEHPLVINSTDSGGMMYNSLCMLDDHTIGVLYEYNWHIYFTRIDVSDKVDTPEK